MLVYKDLRNKNMSQYRCDACYRTVYNLQKVNIDVDYEFKWHLCKICYKRVCRFIENNCHY